MAKGGVAVVAMLGQEAMSAQLKAAINNALRHPVLDPGSVSQSMVIRPSQSVQRQAPVNVLLVDVLIPIIRVIDTDGYGPVCVIF